jgi:chaperonin GroES
MSKSIICPLGDRIVVKEQKREERTATGIYRPDIGGEKEDQLGTVIACGPGIATHSSGPTFGSHGGYTRLDFDVPTTTEGERGVKRCPLGAGDVVMFKSKMGLPFEHEGEKYLLLSYAEVIGVVAEA